MTPIYGHGRCNDVQTENLLRRQSQLLKGNAMSTNFAPHGGGIGNKYRRGHRRNDCMYAGCSVFRTYGVGPISATCTVRLITNYKLINTNLVFLWATP